MGKETTITRILKVIKSMTLITIMTLISILTLIFIFHTDIAKVNIFNNSTLHNEDRITNQTSESKQELLLLAYYSMANCQHDRKKTNEYKIQEMYKNKGWCNERFEWFCNIVRINGQILNGSINYIGNDDTAAYLKGHLRKIFDVYDYLKLLQSKYTVKQQKESIVIMFSDAWDTLYQQNITKILYKFNKLNITKTHVLWQAEKNCSPRKNCHLYPDPPPNNGGAKYLNAGGYIGYLYYVIQNFEQFIQFMQDHQDAKRITNDQDVIVRHFVNNSTNQHMALDYYSYITQAMVKMYYRKVILKEKGYFNKITENYPSAIHFNGPKQNFVSWINRFAEHMLTETNGKINGDFEIRFTNYNVTKTVKYRDYCSNFTTWYY